MLELINIKKSFSGKTPILKNVNFKVRKGEFLFLSGVSGAGKTTIFKMFLGLESYDEGKILFLGKDIKSISNADMPYHRRKIGMVFQDYKLLNKRTVEENLSVPLMIQGLPQNIIGKKVKKLADEMKIPHLLPQKVFSLSGGEQQLTAIARAAIASPSLLMADEPTANLDSETAKHILDILKGVQKKGTTVMIATHDIQLIKEYADRILLIKNQEVLELYQI